MEDTSWGACHSIRGWEWRAGGEHEKWDPDFLSGGNGEFCLAACPAVETGLARAGRDPGGPPRPLPARPLPAVPLSRGRGRPAPRLRVAAWGGGDRGQGSPFPKPRANPTASRNRSPATAPQMVRWCASLHACTPASLHPCSVKGEMAGTLHPCFPASLPHEGRGSLQLASLPLAGPAPATPAFVFPKDPRELDEAQSGTSRMFCGGNSCDVHMDEETPRGDDRRLNNYPRCQGKGEEG